MTIARVEFGNQQASGLEELSGASPAAINVVVDDNGVVRRRPGIATYAGAPSTVVDANGIANLTAVTSGVVYAVGASGAERPIYRVTGGAASALGGGLSPAGLRGTLRPQFAETQLILAMAGGDAMQKVVLSTATSSRLGGSPPTASHVIAISSRLLANDLLLDPSKIRFSDIANGNTTYAGLEVWSLGGIGTSGFFSAEAKPDPVIAIGNNSNEVFVWGLESTQVFQPDPTYTFAPVASREYGLASPYSVVEVDEMFFWLDPFHRFIRSDGRTYDVISDPIQKTLDDIGTVSDCFGYRIVQGYLDNIVWTFPTDGRTFVFQKKSGWAEWQGWSSATNNLAPFQVSCHTHHPFSSADIVGTLDGHIGQLALGTTTDLGSRVVARSRTGYIDHDTDSYKQCKSVSVSLRRGESGSSPGPLATLRWRDRPGAWTGQIPIDLGSSGDTETVLPFYGLGTYRKRQWEFEFGDSAALSLVSITEDFEALGV